MRIKSVITTLVGVALAGGSVYIARESLRDPSGAAIASPDSAIVEVAVARADIEFGHPISRQAVVLQKWPREALPAGSFTDLDALLGNGGELRRAKGKIFAGEVLLATKLSDFGAKMTLVNRLGENTRAMAIKVDAVTAVGGFVTPGDHVDIVMTQGNGGDMRAVTILQNIRVIGVDQQAGESIEQAGVARTITVEVTPEEGQRLALAQKAGTLNLTLRTLDGVEDKPLDMVDLHDLLREKSPMPEAENAPTIKIRRANVVEVVSTN